MIRRLLTFLVSVLTIGTVASIVFLNADVTKLSLAPGVSIDLRLGYLVLAAIVLGGGIVAILFLLRETVWAFHDWREDRKRRRAELVSQQRVEGHALMLAGQHGKARALFKKATLQASPSVLDLVDYAETFAREGKLEEARKALEGGIKDFGNDPLLLTALAGHCQGLGDHAAAVGALERAIASCPESLPALRTLRDVLMEQENWRRADEIQDRIFRLAPTDIAARRNFLRLRMTILQRTTGEEREGLLKSVLAVDPEYGPALAVRARLMAEDGDIRGALKLLEKTARKSPSNEVFDELERIAGSKELTRVIKTYRKVLGSRPDDVDFKLRMARCLLHDDQVDEASRMLKEAASAEDESMIHALWAEVYRRQSKPDLAEQFYRKALGRVFERYDND